MPVHGKFKFCFLELSGIFFPEYFPMENELVESPVAEAMDMDGRLYVSGTTFFILIPFPMDFSSPPLYDAQGPESKSDFLPISF